MTHKNSLFFAVKGLILGMGILWTSTGFATIQKVNGISTKSAGDRFLYSEFNSIVEVLQNFWHDDSSDDVGIGEVTNPVTGSCPTGYTHIDLDNDTNVDDGECWRGLTVKDGYTGLGTTSPSSLLDLEKTGTAKANIDILEITNSGNAVDMDATETSVLFNQYYYDATTPAVADSARISAGTEQDWTSTSSTQDSYLAFSTALDGTLTEHLRIDSDGDVGIGTTSSTNPGGWDFRIYQDASMAGEIGVNDASARALWQIANYQGDDPNLYANIGVYGSSYAGNYATNIPYAGLTRFEASSSNLAFGIVSGAIEFVTNTAERMRILSTGEVGIGTIAPDRKFHTEVSDALTSSVTPAARFTHISSNTPAAGLGTGIEFEVETADGNNEVIGAVEGITTSVGSGTEDGALIFKTMTDGATASEKLRIDSDGNVLLTNDSWIRATDNAGTSYVNLMKLNSNDSIQIGGSLQVDGGFVFPEDSGAVRMIDMPVSDSASDGDEMSYGFGIDGTDILKISALADGSGGIDTKYVGINNTSPTSALDVTGTVTATAFSGDGSALTNLGGASIAVDTIDWSKLIDAMELDATTTIDMDTNSADLNFDSGTLYIDNAGYVGIGTSSPSSPLTIANDSWISAINNAGTGIVNLFKLSTSDFIEVGGPLYFPGGLGFPEDSGVVTAMDMSISDSASDNTVESYAFKIDGENILKVSAQADGSGGIDTKKVFVTGDLEVSGTTTLGGNITIDADSVNSDTIGEKTTDNGVEIDGLLIKDSGIAENLTLTAADPALILDGSTASDTDFWLGVTADEGGDDNDYFQIGDGTTPGTNPFVTIDTSGNVGIGTESPSGKLDILNDSDTIGNGSIIFTDANPSYPNRQVGIRATADPNIDLAFDVSYGDVWSEAMRILRSNGYVGIGTNSPDRLFHTEASDAATITVTYGQRLSHITSDTPAAGIGVGLEFEQETADDNNEIGAIIEAVTTDVTDTSEDFDLVFKNMAAGAAAAETMRITSDGWLAKGSTKMFKVNASNQIDVGAQINVGTLGLSDDSGVVNLVNMGVTDTPTAGDDESYSFSIDDTPIMTVFSEADGSGGIQNERVGIGTITPSGNLHVYQASPSADQVLFQVGTSDAATRFSIDEDGDVVIAGNLDVNGTSSFASISVDAGGDVGIGSTPSSRLDVEQSGTAKANTDILELTNTGNAADMDATETSVLFNQFYYDASTPAVADAGRISVGTEQDWTSTGSTQDSYLAFETALDGTVTEYMRLSSAGKLSLTTADPSLILDGSTTNDTDFWLGVTADEGGDDNDYFQIGDGTTPGTNPFMTIDTSGKVFIGESGVADTQLRLYSDTASAYLDIANNGNYSAITTSGSQNLSLISSGASGYITFNANAAERMRITRDGTVGIGTTSPDRLFHTEVSDSGTNTVTYGQRISHITSGTAAANFGTGIEFELESGSGNNAVVGSIESILTDATDSAEEGALIFKTADIGDDGLAERARIDKDGNMKLANNTWLRATDSAGTGNINMFRVNGSDQIEVGGPLSVPSGLSMAEDSGVVTALDMPVSSSSTDGDEMSYTYRIDGTNILKVKSLSDGAGGVDTPQVVISPGSVAGSASSPMLTFGDGDTGFYESSDDALEVSIAGAQDFTISANLFSALSGSVITSDDLDATTATTLLLGKSTATKIEIADTGIETNIQGTLDTDEAANFDSTITIANDTWTRGVDNAGTGTVNMFKVGTTDEIYVGGALNVGTIEATEDSGPITLVNMPVSSTPTDGDEMSYSFMVDADNILKIKALADGAGGSDNEQVVILPGAVGNSASTPSLAFGDGDSGFYESADDTLNFSIATNNEVSISAAAITTGVTTTTQQLIVPISNDPATPTFAFGDGDTGMYESADDVLKISNAGIISANFNTVASGVNYLDITPSATTSPVLISAAGTDTDIDLKFTPKGTGIVRIPNNVWIGSTDNAGTGTVNMFRVNTSDEIEVGASFNVGTIDLAEDSGVVGLVNLPVSATPADGTEESYTFGIDSTALLKVKGSADNSGGADELQVIVAPTVGNLATLPSLAFGDGDTGFYESADDALNLSLGGAQKVAISGEGNLGFAIETGATTTGAITIDLDGGAVQTIALTGDVDSMATSNRSATIAKTVMIVFDANGGDRTFTSFNASWKWIGTTPASLATGNKGILTLTNIGSAETDIIASYEELN